MTFTHTLDTFLISWLVLVMRTIKKQKFPNLRWSLKGRIHNALFTTADLCCMSMRYGIDQGVKIERWKVRVLCLDEDDRWGMVPGEMDVEREGVVEVRERDSVLSTQRLANNDLVDVIKLIPILISVIIEILS